MSLIKTLLVTIILTWSLHPLEAVRIRVATYNVLNGLGDVGQPGRSELEAVLARINADVVGLQEVFTADFSGAVTHLDSLQTNLGYPHAFIPTGALDTQSRAIILSKFPFVSNSTKSIKSPLGANDVTRAAAAAIIDVPGTTNDPVVVNAHLKCCFDNDDPFRRAIEMIRIEKYLEDLGVNETDNIFVMGDLNLLGSNQTFSAVPAGVPPSYVLGNDIVFDVQYFSNPENYFTSFGLTNPGYRQQNGVTTDTFMGSITILDHLLVSNAIASKMPMTEIYNSSLESSFSGLPKSGNPLPSSTSGNASDHYPVYGDFELDGGLALAVGISPSVIDEDSPASTVTVSLQTAATSPTLVTLQSSDPGEADLISATLTIPAGATSASTTLLPKLDLISDGNQVVSILANSEGYEGGISNATIRDADPTIYVFKNSTTPLTETFANFDGSQSLSAWSDEGVTWRGLDDGSGITLGARSYDQSLGIITTEDVKFSANFRNDATNKIDALSISLSASQWRRFVNGSNDKWEVVMNRAGHETTLSELAFEASTGGTPGKITPPLTEPKQTIVRGLNLLPGEEFSLKFHALPGDAVGSSSNDVFINEIHYDNAGADQGEFVEILLGAGFTGDLSQVSLYLYNGNNGLLYGVAHPLSSFSEEISPLPGSPRFFTKEISGIQNGSPDGMALVINGEVREFISYEGSFTATSGPATGMTSTMIGVSQSSGTPAGRDSIARTGSGGGAGDFTWAVQSGPHTPGKANVGQFFGASPQPQGIAIDNLTLTPLSDQDGDLLTDVEENNLGTDPTASDSDLDGQDDFFEAILAGSDPLDSSSYLIPQFESGGNGIFVYVPSQEGFTYFLEFSSDLGNWQSTSGRSGTGQSLVFELPDSDRMFVRIRISQ